MTTTPSEEPEKQEDQSNVEQILIDLIHKIDPNAIYATKYRKEAIAALNARQDRAVAEARISERNIERQELLKAYRFTAHNSGFGRQLKDNLTRNAKRIDELTNQKKPNEEEAV